MTALSGAFAIGGIELKKPRRGAMLEYSEVAHRGLSSEWLAGY